jgi:hypothetical protein
MGREGAGRTGADEEGDGARGEGGAVETKLSEDGAVIGEPEHEKATTKAIEKKGSEVHHCPAR